MNHPSDKEPAMTQRYSIVLLVTSAIAGCDAQVDSTHNGTALAQIEGTVRNQRTQSVGDAEVAIVWRNTELIQYLMPAEIVDVQGNFPAAFRISVYAPPPDALLNVTTDNHRFGVATIFAGKPGIDYADPDSVEQNALGMDPDHWLVYLPEDVAAGSVLATLLRGTPHAGFHLYTVGHLSDAEQRERSRCRQALPDDATFQEVFAACGGLIFDDFLVAPDDLETPIQVQLVDDLAELDIPE
jgi:hypothetical protein